MKQANLPDSEEMVHHIMMTSELVWPKKLTRPILDKWLSNFKGEVFSKKYEQQLALWLLTHFVYYNENEVRHLCRTLYRDFIHHEIVTSYEDDDSIEERLNDIRQRTLFYNLGRAGESGGYILYYFRKENKLANRDFIKDPSVIHHQIDHIVFVDDVTLSGENGQAIKYLREVVNKYFIGKKITLLTLLASEEAIEYLGKAGVKVINSVTLTNRNKCFCVESNVFHYHSDKLDDCLKFAQHYGMKLIPDAPLGFNNGQYLFGFFYNTPDNSLPILWCENNGWSPIVKRYHKNYGKTDFSELGRFI